ncbi:hypothetical protein GCM10025868_05510 [Angustibacter aerolatus]|uniref:Inositol-phosphate phosphatase n=1 Tax=Angustibacter aerolatus TaxID=1162965 RepID=A0ABQ6JAT9_9ACTN|nr:inositol monophosphatase family protein [Angustibacter aerolatus]GMA85301.1 hypothetical protein GCM10025868_05510 [Angustibacter aerolatus]
MAGTSGLTWVVDPIDGTVNYLYEIPAYAVSIAVVTGDPRTPGGYEVLAGVVHNPVLGETFSAVRGRGARLTDPRGERPLAVRVDGDAVTDLGQALLATGFGYEARRRVVQAEVVQQAAAAGAGHPADRQRGARPLQRGGRAGRRLLRARPQPVGPRGR